MLTRRQWIGRIATSGAVAMAALATRIGVARAATAPETPDEAVAGKVVKMKGSALAIQDAVPRVLALGSEIFTGDVISTGKGARLEMHMVDGTEMTLGERTQFVVVDFVFRDKDSNAVLRILEGAFKATSGKIMQTADASMVVETPTATIGIRGTTFWGGVLDEDFEVALLAGKGVYVETKAGRVELDTVGDGTKVLGGDKAPTKPKSWAAAKIARAVATVDF